MAMWREVAGYEGLYAVSDEGEVISLPRVINNGRGSFRVSGKLLKQGTRAGKYKFVHLSKKTMFIIVFQFIDWLRLRSLTIQKIFQK